jgi:hypothetical protein
MRDVDATLRDQVTAQLTEADVAESLLESLREYIPPGRSDAARMFGESLPEGLVLVG